MSIEWFDVVPGADIGQSQEDPTCLLAPIDPPDFIRVPEQPGFGKEVTGARRVLAAVTGRCARPGHAHAARHYILEGPISVCVCYVNREALWYERKEAADASAGVQDRQPGDVPR